jgi:hypothetical protein
MPRLHYQAKFPGKNSKIGNKSFPESRNVTMSHRLCLLPVTGNYISELSILIILKFSARQRWGYNTNPKDYIHHTEYTDILNKHAHVD